MQKGALWMQIFNPTKHNKWNQVWLLLDWTENLQPHRPLKIMQIRHSICDTHVYELRNFPIGLNVILNKMNDRTQTENHVLSYLELRSPLLKLAELTVDLS